MTVRKYEEKDLTAMIQIWNEVVEDGIAFPQEELLTPESGKAFFAGQTLSCVAEEDGKKMWLWSSSVQCCCRKQYSRPPFV